MFTSLLTFTTMTTDLNYGIESLLSPLKKIKVPVEVLSMMISLTLRSIPTLLEETEKIMKAQSSRGSDFKESKLKEKVVQIIALLIPVFVISFKRSEELANAMEARGYVLGQKRSRIDTYKLGFVDYFSLFCLSRRTYSEYCFKGFNMRYKVLVSYDGSNYIGFQKQEHGLSIQREIEKAFKNMTQIMTPIYASGRTDKHVHAKAQVFSF